MLGGETLSPETLSIERPVSIQCSEGRKIRSVIFGQPIGLKQRSSRLKIGLGNFKVIM